MDTRGKVRLVAGVCYAVSGGMLLFDAANFASPEFFASSQATTAKLAEIYPREYKDLNRRVRLVSSAMGVNPGSVVVQLSNSLSSASIASFNRSVLLLSRTHLANNEEHPVLALRREQDDPSERANATSKLFFMDERQSDFVIAHELSHIRNMDGILGSTAVSGGILVGAFAWQQLCTATQFRNRFILIVAPLLLTVFGAKCMQSLFWFQELRADAEAVSHNSERLVGGIAYFKRCEELQNVSGAAGISSLNLTHPPIATRIGQLSELLLETHKPQK